jgi:hypothetical protein
MLKVVYSLYSEVEPRTTNKLDHLAKINYKERKRNSYTEKKTIKQLKNKHISYKINKSLEKKQKFLKNIPMSIQFDLKMCDYRMG